MTGREAALLALYQVQTEHAYSDLALKHILKASGLANMEKAFATELVYGSIRYKLRLDYCIKAHSNLPLKKLSPFILNILRLSIYQLLFLTNIPQSAVLNEAVKLARRYGHRASAGFVNGVLRSLTRNTVSYPNDPLENLSLYYSFPLWFAKRVLEQYGYDEGKKLLQSLNQHPPVTVRTNTLKTTAEELSKQLQEEGVTVIKQEGPLLSIEKSGDISSLPSFQEGLFTVQDKAAYLAGAALAPQAGELILDVCAAPGGKTTHLAELSGDKAKIVAFDLHPHKIEIIERNAQRLGITSIQTICHDSSIALSDYVNQADRVLVDAPCSGLGIIRKKPDIKWEKEPADIKKLAHNQQKLIAASSSYLKPGGRLVYSTCTITEEENGQVIQAFLADHPDFQLISEKTYLPHLDGTDGFYICVLERKN